MKKLLFLVPLICGCTIPLYGEPHDTWVISEGNPPDEEVEDIRYFRASVDFSQEEREKIMEYLGLLSIKTGHYIGVVFNRPHMPTDDDGELIPGERKVIFKTNGAGGLWHPVVRVITIGKKSTEQPGSMARVVAHEMGHDLGLVHIEDESYNSLMVPKWDFSSRDDFVWSDKDQESCILVKVCK